MSFASSRAQRAIVAGAVGLFLAASAPSAMADPEGDAKDLFQRGYDLRKNNDCASAVPLFRKAYAIYPSGLGSLRNVAECEEQLGHFASSRRAWLDLKRALITAPETNKYKDWDADAEQAAARLKPKVAAFVVDVIVKSPTGEAPASEKSGVSLFVNGEQLASTLVGTPLERDPGTYVIRAEAKDAHPVEQSVTLNAGDNPHLTLRLTVTPPAATDHIEPPPVAAEDHSTRRTVGWIVTGVGAAALAGGVVTLLLRQSALSSVDDTCGGDHTHCKATPAQIKSDQDKGKTMSTLTSVLLPVGAVGVAAGLVLVFTSGSSKKETAELNIAPTIGGLAAWGKF